VVSSPPAGYPRPQLRREEWISLDGEWDFAVDPARRWSTPGQVTFNRRIVIPFAPETLASGIGDEGFYRACWYRRTFRSPELADGQRLVLRFGAVDEVATVWLNDRLLGRHEGGYTPFDFDLTDDLIDDPEAEQALVVRAEDDPRDLAKPRGKQDWEARPHAIWYPRTTGIWQTVWLERLNSNHIATIRWTPNLEDWAVGLEVEIGGAEREDIRLSVQLRVGEGLDRTLLVDDTYTVVGGKVSRRIVLPDPGIGDARAKLLWSPESPTLLRARVRLWGLREQLLDDVTSYTALRSVGTADGRFLLNGRPYPLRMALDQGYWPRTGLTPPDDGALRRDVELARAMGFNGVRKHQKIEDPRYLYWADALGLLVWEEMPSAYAFTPEAIEGATRTWVEAIRRDRSHPSVVAWVPFNESWGVPDLATNEAQRSYVQALYHLTRALDPSRPVVGNTGWEQTATDVLSLHDYDADTARLARRFGGPNGPAGLLETVQPHGRRPTLAGFPYAGQPIMLTEFGGLAIVPGEAKGVGGTWGYRRYPDAATFAREFVQLMDAVRAIEGLAGFCYTQFADTYQEANGLLTEDRTAKIPLDLIRAAVTGQRPARAAGAAPAAPSSADIARLTEADQGDPNGADLAPAPKATPEGRKLRSDRT
jgi:beta-galactosidase/beta-glucuronidase